MAISLAVAFTATGCGSESDNAETSRPAQSPAVTSIPTQPTSATAQQFKPTQQHAWTLAAEPGDIPTVDTGERLYQAKLHVTIALGALTSADSSPTQTSLGGLAEDCDVDRARDAYLPLRATLRNEGPFATDTTLALRLDDLLYGRSGDPLAIDAGTTFDDGGATCQLMTGSSPQGLRLNYPSIAPNATEHHDYLLVLHNFFSPNYDKRGNRFRLRHLIGAIGGLRVQVAGDAAGNAISLTDVECYRGTADQGIDGPGVPTANFSVLPAFALSDGGFNFAYGRDDIYYEADDDLITPAKDSGTGC